MSAHRLSLALLSVASIALLFACDDATTPTSPSSTLPVTERFDGQFAVGGGAARAFSASESGTVNVTLTEIGPPADLIVGLGVGIPSTDGSGCRLNQSVRTGGSSNPQLTVTVEAGRYCARVYDVGSMSGQVAFSMTIVHP